MGLIDEAIFPVPEGAARGDAADIRAYEALGQCSSIARVRRIHHVLGRALREPGMEDEDLSVYCTSSASRQKGARRPAMLPAYYQRVFAIDIDFPRRGASASSRYQGRHEMSSAAARTHGESR